MANDNKFLNWLKRITALRIALLIALLFGSAHFVIESEMFEFGFLSKQGLVHLLDLKALDVKFKNRELEELPEAKVIVAAIDEKGVERYGLWPWSRSVIADFIRATTKGGAKVIAFDAVFSDEDKNSSFKQIKSFVDDYEQSGLLEQADNEAAKSYYELLQKKVKALSPDEDLTDALRNSEETILGYFNFQIENEIVGITADEVARDFDSVRPSVISDVYELVEEDVGGAVLERFEAVDLNIKDMQVRSIVAVQAPLPKFAKASKGFGYFNVPPDIDGPMRRVRLLNRHEDEFHPALSVVAAAQYLGGGIYPINGTIKPGVTLDGIGITTDRIIPTDLHGRMLINYYSAPEDYFPTYSVADFIDGTVGPEIYKDKIVLFGMTAMGLYDLRPTPFSATTPGVYIHASAMQNIIDGFYLERYFGSALMEILFYLLLGLMMGLIFPRIPAWGGLLATLAFAVAVYWVDTTYIFSQGIWMLNVLPTMQAFTTFLGVTIHGYLTEGREKRQIRKAFQFYLTKSVVDEMLKDSDKLKLGGEKRTCSVLFSDIRGFTTISERLSPEQLVYLLNAYLTPMTNIVFKYDGTLDKYMGDAIMAIFGAPIAHKDHAVRACLTALDMMEDLYVLQGQWREQGLPEIDIGIGVNTGPMSVGNMGSEIRFDYTVMGDNVNLGSRLEGINKQYGSNIIISEYTYLEVKEHVYAREIDSVRVKGKREPVVIYELLGRGQPNDQDAESIAVFSEAVGFYKLQEWDQAIAAFSKVRDELKPNDFASNMYVQRCEAMRQSPPGPGWDGVFTMTTK
ncbi:MAG: adenylate/guanylate cyclase domain-containing protein [Myxococcota bacterium]|nr:adenylate/guanylate cyclase domain-containing protein [Myxococcota bacterium]